MTNPKESQSDVEATSSGRWDRERVRALINECDRDEREGETWTDMIAAALNAHESQLRAELDAARAERDACMDALRSLYGWVNRAVVPEFTPRKPMPENCRAALALAAAAMQAGEGG